MLDILRQIGLIVGAVALCYIGAFLAVRMDEPRTTDEEERQRGRERTRHNALVLWAMLMALFSAVFPADRAGFLVECFWALVRGGAVLYALYCLTKLFVRRMDCVACGWAGSVRDSLWACPRCGAAGPRMDA